MKRNLRKLFMVSVAIFGIGGSADVFAVNDKSVTDEQTENLIYNPNFSLVRENSYCELIGWNVHDKTVSNPLTGGIGATSATAERVWVRFDNAKGSVNLDGKENTYSTAATFVFPDKPNKFCSSSSEYVYGEDDDYLLNLKPNCRYDFCAQLGYLNEEERGSVTFEIVAIENEEMALPEYVARTFTYTPTTCVSDTTKTPDVIRFSFITRCLGNSQNFKIVVKNTNTNDHWVLVMSNLRLYESESQNLIYNPNFSLVSENEYGQLYGWTIHDSSVEYPLTGGVGATSATSDATWTKFDNAKGSVNADGNENKYSTAASFYFPEKPTYFCSSSSQYVYGEVEGYELLLEPNNNYTFCAQLGFLNEGEKGSVTFKFVNIKTGRVVLSETFEPQVCVSDTTKIPERLCLDFKTDKVINNASSNEPYKLVVMNANLNDHWTLVMSNLDLYKYYKEIDPYVDECLAILTEELGKTNVLLTKKMNSDVENALRVAKLAAESVYDTDESSEVMAAFNALKEKNEAAEVSVKIYEEINACLEKANSLDKAGKAVFDSSVADVKTKWTNGEITDGVEELATVKSKYVDAIKQQTTAGAVMTEAISNWDCTSGYKAGDFAFGTRTQAIVKGWEVLHYEDGAAEADKFDSYNGNPISAYFHVNTWSTEAETGEDGATPMTIPFTEFWSDKSQNELILPNDHVIIRHEGETGYRPGRYTLSIMARLNFVNPDDHKVIGYKFVANGHNSKTKFSEYADGWFYAYDEIDFYVEEDGNIDFKFDLDHPNFYWIAFKMLKLSYEGDVKSDSVNIDITEVNKEESENTTTPVFSQAEEGEPYYVYEPEDATKNQTISFNVPVEVVKADKKYYVVIVLVPTDETRTRPTYLTFELKGVPHKLYDRPSTPVDNVTNVLGSYLYSGEKEERLVYEFTSDVDIESASIRIVTDNPTDDNTDCTNAIGLKQVSLAAETDNFTAIETVASEQTDVVPVGMYSVSGIKQSSFRKGINVVRLSDGSVIKIQR